MKCDCGDTLIAPGDPNGQKARLKKTPNQIKPKRKGIRGYGKGEYCVYSAKGKKVRCFTKKSSAENVAHGFGSGYEVQKQGVR